MSGGGRPHVMTGDEWEAQQYAPHRLGVKPTDPQGAGRVLTGDEWEVAQRAGSVRDLKFPALPKIAPDVTAVGPGKANPNAQELAAFDISDPTTYGNPILRQLINPALENPLSTAAGLAAPFAVPSALGIAIGAGMAGTMVHHIASYGWQKAAELSLSPEDRARAEADPERISGESAAVQAALLGIAPLIHTYVKAAPARAAARNAAEVSSFAETLKGGARARAGTVRPVEGLQAVEVPVIGNQRRVAPVAGLEVPVTPKIGVGEVAPVTSTESPIASAGSMTVPKEVAPTADRAMPLGATASGAGENFALGAAEVGKRRAADAERVTQAVAAETKAKTPVPYFESPQGAEVLGTKAAQHGLSPDASPYPPGTANDVAWKDGFAMGGPESRIPPDFKPPRTPTTEPTDLAGEGPQARGPKALYARLSDDAIKAEYRTLRAQQTELEAAAVPKLWTEADDWAEYNAIEDRRKAGKRSAKDAQSMAMNQAQWGNRVGQMIETPESRIAQRELDRVQRHLTALEEQFDTRKIDVADALKEPGGGGTELPAVAGSGETKVRGLSLGVKEKAIASKLTDYLGDLPEYQTLSMADQAARASKFLADDSELARRVALGDAPPPADLLPESVFVAVENKAIAEGDVGTLRELAAGKLTEQATTMGQRIRTLGERDPESPVAAMQKVVEARTKGVKNATKAVSESLADLKAQVADAVKIDPKGWRSFIDSLRC